MLIGEPRPTDECPHCGAELVRGDDFCRECGHSVQADSSQLGAGALPEPDALDMNAGDICPSCGATHMVILPQGFPQCESCGYTERH